MHDARLARRFLADWPMLLTPKADVAYEGPRWQREVVAIGREQLAIQRAAAKSIASSNLVAADVIANEINQQTVALEASLRDYSNRVSSAVMDAAERMSAAVDVLGDRLCVYLGEMSWQLAQQGETLAGILHGLRESRTNEARQFVKQGIQHYMNEQYERAEERFRQALTQDTTDYQVLTNLGLIAVQKGLRAEALEWFEDALRLPAAHDKASKKEAILNIARLHYATGEYNLAFMKARQAVTVADASNPSDFFWLGTYAALAGHKSECVESIEKAIRMAPALFGRAAVDPALSTSQSDVLPLLSQLAQEARDTVTAQVSLAQALLKQADRNAEVGAGAEECGLARTALDDITREASRASYSELFRLRDHAVVIARAIDRIVGATGAAAKRRVVEQRMSTLVEAEMAAAYDLDQHGELHPVRIRLWFLWHLATWIPIYIVGFVQATGGVRKPSWADVVGVVITAWGLLGMLVWSLAQSEFEDRASAIEARHAEQRAAKSQALLAAQRSLLAARAEVLAHDEDCKNYLAQARRHLCSVDV